MKYLKDNGISTGVHYLPAYMHPIYKDIKAECPIADAIWKKILTLPLFPDMTEEDIQYICEIIHDVVKQFG